MNDIIKNQLIKQCKFAPIGVDVLKEFNLAENFIKTNCCIFDDVRGLLCGGIHVLGGASGHGKSLALLKLAELCASAGNGSILYVSVENDICTDYSRFKFDKYSNNIDYVNVAFQDINLDHLKYYIYNTLEQDKYNYVFIDGLELCLDNTRESSDLYTSGNDLFHDIRARIVNKNTAVVLSWQLRRDTNLSSIDKISIDDFATSMGIVRYASQVYCILRTKTKWSIKRLKCRSDCDFDKLTKEYIIYDNNNKTFDLNLSNTDDSLNYTLDNSMFSNGI